MTESAEPHGLDRPTQQVSARRHPLLLLLVALLALEFVAMAIVSIAMLIALFRAEADTLAGGIAILVLGIIATVWLGFIVVAAAKGRAWMRGAAIVWQVIMFAVGVGCFQGFAASPAAGWALVLPALAVVILLVSPPVVRATTLR